MLAFYLALLDGPEDRARFSAVYETYHLLFLRIARRILGSDALAEEAAQESWIKVCRHFETFLSIPSQKQRAWMVLVVENTAKNLLKREGRLTGLDWDAPAPQGGPANSEGWLLELIAALPPLDRQVLELKLVLGCSDAELGEALGVSKNTAAKRYSRALARLRARLREEGLHD